MKENESNIQKMQFIINTLNSKNDELQTKIKEAKEKCVKQIEQIK